MILILLAILGFALVGAIPRQKLTSQVLVAAVACVLVTAMWLTGRV